MSLLLGTSTSLAWPVQASRLVPPDYSAKAESLALRLFPYRVRISVFRDPALRSRVSEVRKMDIANPSLSSNSQLFAWQLFQVWAVLTRNAPYNPHCA